MAFVPVYILILFTTIIIDYVAGIGIEKQNLLHQRKYSLLLLVVSLVVNVSILAVFKYYNFFIGNISDFFRLLGMPLELPNLNILLPIGLSFHTFQAMSYTIEVYKGNQKAERHFGIYALYVMFYPQLVAGPIERPQQILHQFYEKKYFDYDRIKRGLLLMLFGFFKKIVIADRMAVITGPVFDHPQQFPTTSLLLAAVCFSFQIYCDFSGYTDIAIGSARVMGFQLMQNFNHPYRATSIANFWQRWHISLSSWFRDYIYIPMGGNRVSLQRWCFVIFVVFLLSGLWHGANWTFIVWGILHACYMIIGRLSRPLRIYWSDRVGLSKHSGLQEWINVSITFSLVTIAWVFFRANTIGDALYFIQHIFQWDWNIKLPGGLPYILISLGFILAMEIFHIVKKNKDVYTWLDERPLWFRWSTYYAVVFLILYFGEFDYVQFIYFQF